VNIAFILDPEQAANLIEDLNNCLLMEAKTVILYVGKDAPATGERQKLTSMTLADFPKPDIAVGGTIFTIGMATDWFEDK
jgi:hypothetical protein